MAGGMDLGTSAKGGKRPVDAVINLVPFIDLMAVTISFLIMTAVWTQIGRLQVSHSGGPSMEDTPAETVKTVQLTLVITPQELRLSADEAVFDPIPVARDDKQRLDLSKLQARFKEVREKVPDQAAITLQTDDAVRYDDLVRIIDECLGSGLPQVAVAATAS